MHTCLDSNVITKNTHHKTKTKPIGMEKRRPLTVQEIVETLDPKWWDEIHVRYFWRTHIDPMTEGDDIPPPNLTGLELMKFTRNDLEQRGIYNHEQQTQILSEIKHLFNNFMPNLWQREIEKHIIEKDSSLTLEVLQQVVDAQNLVKDSHENIAKIFKIIDANRDGEVCEKDFRNFMSYSLYFFVSLSFYHFVL